MGNFLLFRLKKNYHKRKYYFANKQTRQ